MALGISWESTGKNRIKPKIKFEPTKKKQKIKADKTI